MVEHFSMPLYIHQHGDTWMFFRLCNLVLEPKIASLRWSNHANPILRGSGSDFNAVGMLNRQPNQCVRPQHVFEGLCRRPWSQQHKQYLSVETQMQPFLLVSENWAYMGPTKWIQMAGLVLVWKTMISNVI